MLIKSGATLLTEEPPNKDGSVGYSAKYCEKLRDDFKQIFLMGKRPKISFLKVSMKRSLLLYFGGTNSWLEIVDENGKSIDEWTKVE